jgi:hypothetical protein
VTGWGGVGGRGKDRGREWIRRGRKSTLEGEQWIVAQEKGGNEGLKTKEKKIVMVKLVIQRKRKRKNTRYSNNKKFNLLGKSPGVIPLVSNLGVCAWYSGLHEER